MGRLIIGATAIVTGLAATVGGLVLRRRRASRDDVLPLDPAPPFGSSAPTPDPDEAPSIEADFGQVDPPIEGTGSPGPTTRKPRAPRKAATTRATKTKTGKASATKADGADAGPAARPKRPTRVRTSPAATEVAESIEPGESDPADGS
ncbi:MAG: hypothetical protein ABI628_02100 [Chloroflexota bacterium]